MSNEIHEKSIPDTSAEIVEEQEAIAGLNTLDEAEKIENE